MGVILGSSIAWADRQDETTLQGLRERGQYAAAEKYCDDVLADVETSDARRAAITIELSRTLSAHALNSTPDEQEALWKRAQSVVEVFVADHPRYPKLILVRLQGDLAAVAEGESTREAAETSGDRKAELSLARGLLRAAISRLRKLDQTILDERRFASDRATSSESRLTINELDSLRMHVRYQLARALRNQALCFPAASADRINALQQALELLTAPEQQQSPTRLAWSSRLDEVVCLRLLEDYGAAEKELLAAERSEPPAAFSARIRAERIRLALARGKLEEALAEAGRAGARNPDGSSDASLAQLEAYLAAFDRAQARRDAQQIAEWEKTALAQVRAIEKSDGPAAARRAQSLWARALTAAPNTSNLEGLLLAAQSLARSGQAVEAVAAYDRAAEQARRKGDAAIAFESAFAAAAVEKDRQNYRAAIDRFRKLSLADPRQTRADEAHLLAVHCAAQWAQLQQPPQLDTYERLLREHVTTWPKAETTAQAWWWLGRLEEHEQAWQEAFRALRNVPPDHPQYVPAIEAAGRAAAAMLAELRERRNANSELTRETIRYFENIITPRDGRAQAWTPAARAAALALVPIWIKDMPGGAAKAEKLLSDAPLNASDSPADWQTAARRWLVVALAAQGKTAEAERELDKIPGAKVDESLTLIESLRDLAAEANGERKQQIATLALSVVDDVLARRDELPAESLAEVNQAKTALLLAADRRDDAIAALEAWGKEHPRDGQSQEELATLLMSADDTASLKAAAAKWREVIGKSRPGSPRWFRANYSVARVALALGDANQARATIKAAQTSHPDLGGPEMKARFVQLLAECDLPTAPARGTKK